MGFPTDPTLLARNNIVACQAHPALVKIGPVFVPLFIFDSLLACIHVLGQSPFLRTKGLTTVSRRGLADWWFVGDPAPLARDNMKAVCPANILNRYFIDIFQGKEGSKLDAPLANMLRPELRHIDVHELFPEFKRGKVSDFKNSARS